MRIADLLERRKASWRELEEMCEIFSSRRFPFVGQGAEVAKFSALYRAACTDLSMADQYHLPPSTVEYLHRLVGRAHSQLYRYRNLPWTRALEYVTMVIPHAVFRDVCVIVAAVVFFGSFTLAAVFGANSDKYPNFVESIVGGEQVEAFEDMYSQPVSSRDRSGGYLIASAGYIRHNTGIGLQCFAFGPLLLPTICILGYNGMVLGAVFGYMLRSEVAAGENFMEFVTAHGAFELTAIALAAAAGLRIGVGVFSTAGMKRVESFRLNAERSIPIVLCAVGLFIAAAFVEGCISPSSLPYLVKSLVAVGSSSLLLGYFVLLGFPTKQRLALLATNEMNPWRDRTHATR